MIYLEEYKPRERAVTPRSKTTVRRSLLGIVCEVIALLVGIVILLLGITTINAYDQMRAIGEMWVKAWRLI